MWKWKRAATLVAIIWLGVAPAHSESAAALNPLATITDVRVEAHVWGTVGSTKKDPLFASAPDSRDDTKARLRKKMATVLTASGYRVTDASPDTVRVDIWGHLETLKNGDAVYVFMLEVTATDTLFVQGTPCESDEDLVQSFRSIGVSPQVELAAQLESEMLRLLNEMLPDRNPRSKGEATGRKGD